MTMLLQNADLYLNLKRLRQSSGLSQYELVAQMRTISRSTYAKIEQGSRNIKVTDIVALKRIYNVEFSEFFDGIGTC